MFPFVVPSAAFSAGILLAKFPALVSFISTLFAERISASSIFTALRCLHGHLRVLPKVALQHESALAVLPKKSCLHL